MIPVGAIRKGSPSQEYPGRFPQAVIVRQFCARRLPNVVSSPVPVLVPLLIAFCKSVLRWAGKTVLCSGRFPKWTCTSRFEGRARKNECRTVYHLEPECAPSWGTRPDPTDRIRIASSKQVAAVHRGCLCRIQVPTSGVGSPGCALAWFPGQLAEYYLSPDTSYRPTW